jgi:trans-aconitate methyltransferase
MPQTWPPQTELCELATKYGTDKYNWHSYTPHYHRLLNDRRNEVRKVLEIGIGDPSSMSDPTGKPYVPGASLRMWAEYFPNAEIYSLDSQANLLINEGRIRSFQCDQGDRHSLEMAMPKLGAGFDLIVDDGSHVPEHQALTATMYVPLLAPNGVYIIEDVWLYPSQVGWSKEPFGLKLEDIPYKTEVLYGEGNNDDRLILIKAGR